MDRGWRSIPVYLFRSDSFNQISSILIHLIFNKNLDLKLKRLMLTLKKITPLINNRIVRWWIVGIAFMAINIALLDWFKTGLYGWLPNNFNLSPEEIHRWSLSLATVSSAEVCTITRYVINDCWVFGNPHPTWKRCGEYHIANASSFFVWCFIIIALGEKLQVDHRIAALVATVVSVCLSMATNFLWIWRRTPQTKSLGNPREKLQATSEE